MKEMIDRSGTGKPTFTEQVMFVNLPRMQTIRQPPRVPALADPALEVRSQLQRLPLRDRLCAGDTVAVTVGSRGIADIAAITGGLVAELRACGTRPFIIPAMGSHGGGTAEGQRAIVEGFGITEQTMGVRIKSSMDVAQIGRTPEGIPVFVDRHALAADHIAVVGRIKPHTDFSGEVESGLHKMMVIGLGKHRGAALYHKTFVRYGFDHMIKSIAGVILEKCSILLGLAIVETPDDATGLIRALWPEDFSSSEPALLARAREWMPRLPFSRADLLIIDAIGKDISGTGLDTNVVGRNPSAPDQGPRITRIYVRGLTPGTHGNATGMGFADYTHRRLVDEIDYQTTRINCLTGNNPRAGAIPLHFDSDREAIEAALGTVGYVDPAMARVMRIRHTLDLGEVQVSEAYTQELDRRPDLAAVTPPTEPAFDENNDLLPF